MTDDEAGLPSPEARNVRSPVQTQAKSDLLTFAASIAIPGAPVVDDPDCEEFLRCRPASRGTICCGSTACSGSRTARSGG
jgi:hypothetical protein